MVYQPRWAVSGGAFPVLLGIDVPVRFCGNRPFEPVRYGVHRAICIGSVYGDISFSTTFQHGGRRESELVVIAAATNYGPRVERVQKFFAARVTAAMVACDQQCRHPVPHGRNNQVFIGPAGTARYDHPGYAKRYLNYNYN